MGPRKPCRQCLPGMPGGREARRASGWAKLLSESQLLEGAVDLHLHSSPDVDPRRFDDFDLAREAARAGMAAVLIKSHQVSTVERAILASKIVPEIRVFGGLVLNETVGGLNPAAVDLALRMGAKQIWMRTRSAHNHRAALGQPGGIGICTEDGSILPDVLRILELIAASECILGSGHLSPRESCLLVRHARERGVRRILITHPEWKATHFPVDSQAELAAGGGVWFERCFASTTHRGGFTPMTTIAGAIAEVGVETTILSTDLGQPDTPPPAEGFRVYAEQLRSFGFPVDQLRTMMAENPAKLLSLSRESSTPAPG